MHRRRVLTSRLGEKPQYITVVAENNDDLNNKIVQAYIDSGRISEFLNNQNELPTKNDPTFREYADRWLMLYKKLTLKRTTFIFYKTLLYSHIYHDLGDRKLCSITKDDIQRFLNNHSDLSRKTLVENRHLISQIMKDAIEDGIIEKDPTASRRIVIPSDKVTKRNAIPFEEFADILSNVYKLSLNDRRFMILLMFTGMRRGEVLGLMWEDIDFENHLIHVVRNVTHPNQNQPIIGTTKTSNGKRIVPLDAYVQEVLKPYGEKGFILGGDKPITLRTYNNTWKRISKRIDLHGATPHVLRHSYLTYLAATDIQPKTLQCIAGHSSYSFTMDKYVHAQDEQVVQAGKIFHDLFSSVNPLSNGK